MCEFFVRKMDDTDSSCSENLDDSIADKSYEITENDKANEKCDLEDESALEPNSKVKKRDNGFHFITFGDRIISRIEPFIPFLSIIVSKISNTRSYTHRDFEKFIKIN